MATVRIDLSLEDTKGSVRRRKGEVEDLNRELEKTKRLSTGTRSGSSALKATYGPSMGNGEGTEYGRARGAMGNTGASARDFANQAQGLGGLVRLYATWAANVFAVGAAFGALRDAMNTTNMIKGMDQLSAASGTALGTMAKQFADASGGALSLRESMEATTKAVSSGLSQAQFKQLGEVAKQASQALGLNMSDAVSRLTRGITKLEPELLDELGIFTKVGKATEDYAKSVGKSAASLTDFERRQAFANAVLDEGTKKFGEIKIDANPYDQLAASLTNLSQNILSIINTAIGPLVSALSQSPTGLLVAVTAIGAAILKQAIPAIGEYKKSLSEAADFAEARWRKRADEAAQVEKARYSDLIQKAEMAAEMEIDAVDNAVADITKIREQQFKKGTKGYEILSKASQDVTQDELTYLKTLGARYAAQGKMDLASKYDAATAAIKRSIAAEQNFAKITEDVNKKIKERQPIYTELGMAQRKLERAQQFGIAKRAISTASEEASIMGMRDAWSSLNKTVSEGKLNPVPALFARVGGAISIATTKLTGLLGAFSGIGFYIGIAATAFSMLNSLFSANAKETEVFNKAVQDATETTKTATGVFEKFGNTLTTESLIAKANAIDGVTTSINATIAALEKADKIANFWDRQIEKVKNLFGYGLKNEFATSIADQISSGLKVIGDPQQQRIVEDQLKKLLNVKDLKFENIQAALEDIDLKNIAKTGKEIAKVFDVANKGALTTKGGLISVKDGFVALEASYRDLSNTLVSNDPLTKFAQALMKQGFEMEAAFKDPQAAAASLRDIIQDIGKIKLFPEDVQKQLLDVRTRYQQLTVEAERYQSQIKDLDAQIAKQKSIVLSTANLLGDKNPTRNRANAEISQLEVQRRSVGSGLSNVNVEMRNLEKGLTTITSRSIQVGFELAIAKLSQSQALASIARQSSLVGLLPKSVDTIRAQAELDKQKIDLQIKELNQTERLIRQFEIANTNSELDRQRQDKKEIEANMDVNDRKNPDIQVKLDKLNRDIEQNSLRISGLQTGKITQYTQSGQLDKTKENLDSSLREQSTAAKINDLLSQKDLIDLKAGADVIKQVFDDDKKSQQEYIKQLDLSFQEFKETPEYLKMGSAERLQAERVQLTEPTEAVRQWIDSIEERINLGIIEYVKNNAGTMEFQKVLAQKAETSAQADLDTKTQQQTRETSLRTTRAQRQENLEFLKESYELSSKYRELTRISEESIANTQMSALATSREDLAIAERTGSLTDQEISAKTKLLDIEQAQIERSRRLLDIEETRIRALDEIAIKKAQAGGVESATLQMERQLVEARANADAKAAEQDFQAKLRTANITAELTSRQSQYETAFKNSFMGMTDAIVNFAKTGKFSFKDLANSIIEDILRIELRMQAQQIWAALRPGISAGLRFLFESTATPTVGAPVSPSIIGSPTMRAAKGASFDYGIQAFAKGGMFTNEIVDSPTLFKFARGTGLMGEAGPEAIMPLTRDNSGNLGVRAQGGGSNVEVVVNNYSTAKAETRETTDSRGNRRIEIVVGDMVAQEVSRTGSATQNALSSTYGSRPALARR
jgi:lambda family phage tail tape measure protein